MKSGQGQASLGWQEGTTGKKLSTITILSVIFQASAAMLMTSALLEFLTLEDGIDTLSRNVGKDHHSTLRNIPEESRSQLKSYRDDSNRVASLCVQKVSHASFCPIRKVNSVTT
jgi:hypothetical protein